MRISGCTESGTCLHGPDALNLSPMTTTDSASQRELTQVREENLHLKDELFALRRLIDSMQNLMEASEKLRPKDEILDLLEDTLGNALETINAKDGSLLVLDEDTEELVFVVAQGDLPRDALRWRRIPPGEGVAGWVVQNGRATIVNDAKTDERFYSGVDDEFHFRTKSILAAPIIGGGRVLGVLEMLNKQGGMSFSSCDQTLLTIMCRFAGELLYTMLQKDSTADSLGATKAAE